MHHMAGLHMARKMHYVNDSGGEEKFWRGPGLVSPRRGQQNDQLIWRQGWEASGRHGNVTPDVQSEGVGVVPSRCSRQGC